MSLPGGGFANGFEDTMATFGVDFSYSRDSIDVEAMARDGVKFACRYLRDGGKAGKALLPAEAARLTKAGIKIVSNDETNGTQYLGGFDGGRRDAAAALTAHRACGGSSNRPIYFTPLDHDPASLDTAGWGLLRSYARGVVDVLGVTRTGWYGGTAMLRDLLSRDLGRWWWQSLGWREGVWLNWAHIQQYDNGNQRWNGEVDYDRALVADFGQWDTKEDTLTPEEHDALMWLRQNAVALRDQGVRMTDHGDPSVAGRANNLEVVRADIAEVLAAVQAEVSLPLSPTQLSDLGYAIADRLAVLGTAYEGSIQLTPKAMS